MQKWDTVCGSDILIKQNATRAEIIQKFKILFQKLNIHDCINVYTNNLPDYTRFWERKGE